MQDALASLFEFADPNTSAPEAVSSWFQVTVLELPKRQWKRCSVQFSQLRGMRATEPSTPGRRPQPRVGANFQALVRLFFRGRLFSNPRATVSRRHARFVSRASLAPAQSTNICETAPTHSLREPVQGGSVKARSAAIAIFTPADCVFSQHLPTAPFQQDKTSQEAGSCPPTPPPADLRGVPSANRRRYLFGIAGC